MNRKGEKTHNGPRLTRRQFAKSVGVAGGGIILAGMAGIANRRKATSAGSSRAPADSPAPADAALPKRPLGRMGFNATILGMGGTHIPDGSEEDGIAILNRALELGINYFDSASQYGNGESERRYGVWLEQLERDGRRGEVFQTTKTLSRGYDQAAREIEASCTRLRTEYIDLLQVHSINDLETWRSANGRNGSMRAIEASKRDGRVRHIGITGHKDPSVLLRALEDFPFDSVLCTLGIDDRFVGASFAGDALPQFLDKGISIVAMKVFAEGKAVVEGIDLEKCLHYTLSLPISTAIIGMASPAQVEQNVAWVRSFAGMTEDETNALAADVSRLIDTGAIWWKR